MYTHTCDKMNANLKPWTFMEEMIIVQLLM